MADIQNPHGRSLFFFHLLKLHPFFQLTADFLLASGMSVIQALHHPMISRSAKCSCITFLFFLLDKPRNYRLNFFFRLIIHRLFKILFTVVTSLFQF